MPGYSAECVSGHHESCTDPDCRCMCPTHPQNRKGATLPTHLQAIPGLACPNCNRVPRPGDLFCRNDGEKLVSPQRCSCGAIGDKSDRYCAKCGLPFGRFIPEKPDPQFSEEEILNMEAKARSRPSDVEVPPTEVH